MFKNPTSNFGLNLHVLFKFSSQKEMSVSVTNYISLIYIIFSINASENI